MDTGGRGTQKREFEAWKEVVERAHLCITCLEPDGTIVWCNEFDRKLLGLPEDPTGLSILQYCVDPQVAANLVMRTLDVGQHSDAWLQMKARDGSVRTILVNARRDDSIPDRPRVVTFGRDITELVEMKDRLMAGEARYKALFQAIPDPAWLFDRETLRFLHVNDAAVQLYGYSPEEFSSMTILDLRPDDDRKRLLSFLAMDPLPEQREARWRHQKKDGTVLDVEVSSRSVLLDGREARIVVARDASWKAAAERDRESMEARFRIIARATSDVIWDWNVETGELWWSEGFTRTFGYREDEIGVGLDSWSSRLHPDDRDRVLMGLEDAIQEGLDKWEDEYRFQDKQGDWRIILDRGYPLRTEGGKVCRMVGGMVDVTESRKSIEAVRTSEQRLSAIFETEPECVKIVGKDGLLREMNRAGLAMIEADSKQSVIGRNVFGLIHPEDRPGYQRMHQAALGGASCSLQFRMIGLKGTERWMETHSVPLPGPDGIAEEVLSVTLDITAKRRADAFLEGTRRTLELVASDADIECTLSALAGVTADRVHACEVAFLGVLATPGEHEMLALAPADAKRLERWSRWLSKQVAEVQALVSSESPVSKDSDGLGPPLKGSHGAWAVPLHTAGELPAGLMIVRTPQTVRRGSAEFSALETAARIAGVAIRKRRAADEIASLTHGLEQRVEERTKELQEEVAERVRVADRLAATNRELDMFVNTMAHDLKAPLRTIAGFAGVLREDYGQHLDDVAQQYIRTIGEGAIRMATLLDNLLQLAKIGRGTVTFARVNLTDVAKRAVASLGAEVRERRAQVKVQGNMPDVVGHGAVLEQMVQNLVSNGLKFVAIGQSPVIEVAATRDGSAVHLTVKDNGIGIEGPYLEKVFRAFERLHTRAEYPGTGIGLAIVQKAAELHGGRAWAESTPGEGSTFHVILSAGEQQLESEGVKSA